MRKQLIMAVSAAALLASGAAWAGQSTSETDQTTQQDKPSPSLSDTQNVSGEKTDTTIGTEGTALEDESNPTSTSATTEEDKPSPTLSDTQEISGEKTDSTVGDGSTISASETELPSADSAAEEDKPSPSLSDTQDISGEKTDTTVGSAGALEYESFQNDPANFAGEITGGYLAEELIGKDVVDAQGNSVGEISDLLISEGDRVEKVLVDVGGFLGMGEHRVALDIDQLQPAADGNFQIAMMESELEAMPRFERSESKWRVSGE